MAIEIGIAGGAVVDAVRGVVLEEVTVVAIPGAVVDAEEDRIRVAS